VLPELGSGDLQSAGHVPQHMWKGFFGLVVGRARLYIESHGAKTERGKKLHQFFFWIGIRAYPSLHTQMDISGLYLAVVLKLPGVFSLFLCVLLETERKGGRPAKLHGSSLEFQRLFYPYTGHSGTQSGLSTRDQGQAGIMPALESFLRGEKKRLLM